MIEFISNNLAFLIFIVLMCVFLYFKRKNLAMSGPFPFLYILMYKTRWGLDKMNKWANNHPRIFFSLAILALVIGVVGMFASFIFMVWQLNFIVDLGLTQGGGLVLPLKTDAGLNSAVPVFYVPFFYWIIALFVMAIVHEFAHGVIAERFKVRIKSSGFAFMGILAPIFPAAFVEPDEKQMAKKPWWQQVAVLGAGSTSNFIFGFLFFVVWLFVPGFIIDNTMEYSDVSFTGVMNESSLSGLGFNSGKILAIDGVQDNELVIDRLSNLSVNESLVLQIETENGIQDYDVVTFENSQVPDRGMIGISNPTFVSNKESFAWLGNFPVSFERSLFWIWFLNVAIGIMNLLPIWITDGGQIARVMLNKFVKGNNGMRIYHFVSLASFVLIVFTVWPKLLYLILGLF